MTLIKFSYNLEKDLKNYKNSVFEFKYPKYNKKIPTVTNFLLPSFVKKLNETKDLEAKTKLTEEYLRNFEKKHSKFIEIQIKSLQEYWEGKESDYIKKIEEFFGVKVDFEKVNCHFTTLAISPYDVKNLSFMTSIFTSLARQTNTVMHEFMHLVFRTNFENYCLEKGLVKQAMLEINESFTVLLNYEFSDLIIIPADDMKESTLDLKSEIVKLWKEKKPFKVILDRLIEMRLPEDI